MRDYFDELQTNAHLSDKQPSSRSNTGFWMSRSRNGAILLFLGLMVAIPFSLLTPVTGLAAVQDGAVDLTFKSGSGFDDYVDIIIPQSGGKFLVGGAFSGLNGAVRGSLARLNGDGTLDSSFNPGGTGANALVKSVAIQDDGKILVGGQFTSYNGTARNRIVRLNSDGALDSSFNSGSGTDNDVESILSLPDGKILIAGSFTGYNGVSRGGIARLNGDGTLDSSFNLSGSGANLSVYNTTILSDGKILIGGRFTSYNGIPSNSVARLNSDGTLDSSFNSGSGANAFVAHIAVQDDGKILLVGGFTSYNGAPRNSIARLNGDGTLDSSFNPVTAANNSVTSVAIQSNGKILLGGSIVGPTSYYITRLNSDGTLDSSFNPESNANSFVYHMVAQSSGKIAIVGSFTSYNGTPRNRIAQLNSDGTLDSSFTPDGGSGANTPVRTMAIQSDGKIVLGGTFTVYNGIERNRVARLNSDSTLDSSFNPGTGANNIVQSVAIQSDGKIVLGGFFTSYNGLSRGKIARLNSDGTLDNSFNSGTGADGDVGSVAIQNDGKILIGGWFNHYNGTARNQIARLNSDGTLDTNFNPAVATGNVISSIVIQTDGKILLGGSIFDELGTSGGYVARLNSDGSLDSSFNPEAGVTNAVHTIAIQSDGKILVGGRFNSTHTPGRIARLNSDGTVDRSFNPGTGADSFVESIAIQSDGKILIGGRFTKYNGIARAGIARLNSNGTLDTSFSTSARTTDFVFVYSVAIQNDGKVLIGGFFTVLDLYVRNYVARLENTIKPASNVTLSASLSPSELGQSVIFTATVNPGGATGTVAFVFDGQAVATSMLTNGVATYVTNTLSPGVHNIIAQYSGDATYSSSNSQPLNQVVKPACNSQIVTNIQDDGQATVCGTFSYALATTTSGTISFALTTGNTISFTGSLTPTVKPNVAVAGGVNGIILNGNGVQGDGLRLDGNNLLSNLTIRNFRGRGLVVIGGTTLPSQFYRIKLEH